MSIIKRAQQWGTFAKVWHLYDAKWQDPFLSAKVLTMYLKGSVKPIYHPTNLCGDHVVIINSKEIALRGNEWQLRMYFHHTTFAGGASWTRAWELHKKDPTMVMKKAVYSALGNNVARRYAMKCLHVFYDDNIPENIKQNISNQIPQLKPVPITMNEITTEEIENFPKISKLPKSFVLK